MKTSEAGLDLIKRFEGVRLKAYDDGIGIATIGVGHTKGVKMGDTITEEQVDALLAEDLKEAEAAVNKGVKVPIEQHHFDSLASLAFNIGAGAFGSSTILRMVNAHDFDGAADQFLRWNKAAGQVMAGLTKRRIAERMLFLTGAA